MAHSDSDHLGNLFGAVPMRQSGHHAPRAVLLCGKISYDFVKSPRLVQVHRGYPLVENAVCRRKGWMDSVVSTKKDSAASENSCSSEQKGEFAYVYKSILVTKTVSL